MDLLCFGLHGRRGRGGEGMEELKMSDDVLFFFHVLGLDWSPASLSLDELQPKTCWHLVVE